jgi:hypothetical protein
MLKGFLTACLGGDLPRRMSKYEIVWLGAADGPAYFLTASTKSISPLTALSKWIYIFLV